LAVFAAPERKSPGHPVGPREKRLSAIVPVRFPRTIGETNLEVRSAHISAQARDVGTEGRETRTDEAVGLGTDQLFQAGQKLRRHVSGADKICCDADSEMTAQQTEERRTRLVGSDVQGQLTG